ncbi:GGDEF domain-containing protein [Billgrantia azerbaijanica]|nr:GGDEF domain-containing protein [Halomonas azerbaijanica]
MTGRGPFALGWRMALAFTLLSGICALAIGLYMVQARQHVGANYTALVADVVRAQQHPIMLRATLDGLQEPSRLLHERQLENLLWRIPQHIAAVTHGLERSQLNPDDYAPQVAALRHAESRLSELQALIDGGMPETASLIALGREIENELAWAYSELNEQVHAAAADQLRILERFSWAIGLLVLLALLVVGGLMLALLHLSRQREIVTRLSLIDELTGLGNRRYLLETAKRLHEQSLRNGRPLSLLLLDLDHFKQLNDAWGHPAGDRVLAVFARALREETRQADTVTRIGGEEFCILMPDTEADGALELAERIRQRVTGLDEETLGVPSTLTVSLGLATGSGPESDFDGLYSRADRALYLAKTNGRNCIELSPA